MTNEYAALSTSEQNAVLALCILAAFADGDVTDFEREEIKRIADQFSGEGYDLTSFYQQALAGRASASSLAQDLKSPNAKALAYELAVCICNVDKSLNAGEEKFLSALRAALQLDSTRSGAFAQSASELRDQPPVIANVKTESPGGLDEMIRDRAILTGALELMPQRLATMAIVPVQMRMVYQIGKAFGYELDLNHTKEFFATVGVGLTSQLLEGYVSRIVGQLTRHVAGRFIGALASQATESAIAFATTYALGQAAKTYYQSGRTLSTTQLRELFSSMLNDGRSLQARYSSDIAKRAGSLNVRDFLSLAKN